MNLYTNLMASSLMKKFEEPAETTLKSDNFSSQSMSAQEAFRELMCDGKLNGDAKYYNDLSNEGM